MNSTTVIWTDWYSYHLSRFRALLEHESLGGRVTGIELVGGCGEHAGLQFRDNDRRGLPITTLFPEKNWLEAGKVELARAVWRRLQEVQPNTVLVPGYYTLYAVTAALWAKLHGKRSVLMSETTRDDWQRVWWKELPKRLLIWSLFDYAIAGGKPHIRYLRALGVSRQRIARFYDVVDNAYYIKSADRLRKLPRLRAKVGLPKDFFLYVGRLAPEKNIDGLLDAFAGYAKAGGTWSLVLVGDGAERRRLEQQCRDLGIVDRVHFAGLKKTHTTTLYYALAGCFVLPSVREPWGLVVNEAMASGLPVIVSRRCGCSEDLVHPSDNGYVFDPAQDGVLAERLLAMGGLNPAVREEMGRRSREIISGYSPQHWASEVARVNEPNPVF